VAAGYARSKTRVADRVDKFAKRVLSTAIRDATVAVDRHDGRQVVASVANADLNLAVAVDPVARDDESVARDSEFPARDNEFSARDNESPARDADSSARDNDFVARDNESPAMDSDSPASDDDSLARDDESLAKDDESLAKDDEPLARDDESLAKDDDSFARDNDSLARDNDSLARDNDSLAMDNDGVAKVRDSVAGVAAYLAGVDDSVARGGLSLVVVVDCVATGEAALATAGDPLAGEAPSSRAGSTCIVLGMRYAMLLPLVVLVGCGSSGSKGTPVSPDATSPDGGEEAGNRVDAGHRDARSPTDAHAAADASITKPTDAGSKAKLGPLMGAFIGVDGFVDDPSGFLPTLGNVREYHDWGWSEGNGDAGYPGYPNNQNSFILFGGYWDFDTFYGGLKEAGVTAYPVIQGGVAWLNGGAVPPVPSGASTTDPASYAAHADEMFQYAARYGSTKVATSLLKLAPGQPVLTGMNVLGYIEDFNEEDAWWVNADGSPVFSPDAYAAMASADIDGNQGKMGKTLGLKNADPNMKFVMGGLAGHATGSVTWEKSVEAYLDGVRAWATANRGGDFPADVINAHYYSFGPSSAGTANPEPALSPEDDHVKDNMSLLATYRNQNLPGKELWLTEFGYDTDPQSILHAPAIGSNSAEVVQGQWSVRYYLALVAAGFDRAFLFASRDSCADTSSAMDTSCATQFATAGVGGVKGAETPKTAYYFIATLRSRLASYAWLRVATTTNPSVYVYEFEDPATGKGAYVVWSGTSTGNVVHGYSLAVPGATTASAVTLVDAQTTGAESALTVASGAVMLDVAETPTIVLVDAIH
jgi:hypothetical protein